MARAPRYHSGKAISPPDLNFGAMCRINLPRPKDHTMFLMIAKRPRKLNRRKTARHRAKIKAKNRQRRIRVSQRG